MQESISQLIKNTASKSNSDKVFIIGKGPSLDAVKLDALPPGVVINLNDSERIRVGDVGIFSANWVRHSLQEDGFRCGFYLAGKPLPPSIPHEVLPPIPFELDNEDLAILRLQKPEFFDEPFVLLNALKCSSVLAKQRGKAIDVYLLGFDFSTTGGSMSRKLAADHSGATAAERDAIISAQDHEFRQLLRFFGSGDLLRLVHVGSKDFSAMSPAAFNRRVCGLGAAVESGPVDLAAPDRVLIVAELTNNHLGDPERLVEMIERAKESGADLIKVQKRDVDSFYTREQLASYYWSPFGETLGDYRRGVELSDDLLDLLETTCRRCGIEWFCSVLDMPSYRALKRFNPRLLKVPSTISNHRAFHRELAAEYRGPLVVSTGATGQEYTDYVLETFPKNEAIYLLHCISAYPTPREACNVAVVRAYEAIRARHPHILPGYSSHDLGSLGSMLAVAGGARMIEKHVKLHDVEWVHFDKVAIDLATEDFARFVSDVRTAEMMVGSGEKRVLECEHHKYSVAT
jgi:N-acetylneuraminate synthase